MKRIKTGVGFLQRNVNVYWPFLIFLAVMIWQHTYIYLYHDDYGLVSLSYYHPSPEVQGDNYTISQMMDFLKYYFLNGGGRYFPFFLYLTIFQWGIWGFRIVQPIVLTVILFFLYKFVKKTNPSLKIGLPGILLSCAFYGLISYKYHNYGTYWATASVIYVWPFLWILAAGLVHQWAVEHPVKPTIIFVLGLLFFLSGFSQEQISLTALFMLAGFLITHMLEHRHGKAIRLDLFSLVIFASGYALLVLAPGNFVRSEYSIYNSFYSMDIWHRMLNNSDSILNINFGVQNLPVLITWMIANTLYLWRHIPHNERGRWGFLALSLLQILYMALFTLLFLGQWRGVVGKIDQVTFWYQKNFEYSEWFWGIFILFASLPLLMYSLRNRTYILFGFYMGGIIAQLTILFIPTANMRMGLIFLFGLFPILIAMLGSCLTSGKVGRLTYLAIGFILTASVVNTGTILNGYKINSPYQLRIDENLHSASREIAGGKDIQSVKLLELPDPNFSAAMQYMPGYFYTGKWIREYYNLPNYFELNWVSPEGEQVTALEIVDYSNIKNITAGIPFNVQPNGQSAFWLGTKNATPNTIVVYNGRNLETTNDTSGITTAFLPEELFFEPGYAEVYLYDKLTGVRSESIQIEIKSP